MKYALVFAFPAALTLAGCVSVAPGAEKVILTHNPKDVTGCKIIGPIQGRGNDDEKRNVVFASGADTFFVTSSWVSAPNYSGVAYNCKGVDLRQPVPVSR